MNGIAPAKVTQPRHEGTIERSRLLARLDSARERPVVWLEAPPGAGKTTLIASYLTTRDVPCLWYRIDATDGANTPNVISSPAEGWYAFDVVQGFAGLLIAGQFAALLSRLTASS